MFYKYKVGYYDSYKDEEVYGTGLAWGTDYGSAANDVIKDYGKDSVFDIYLYEIGYEDENSHTITSEEIKSVLELT